MRKWKLVTIPLFSLFFTLLLSCQHKNQVKVVIDNPTADTLEFDMDNGYHTLLPDSSLELKLEIGNHRFLVSRNSTEVLADTNLLIQSDGIINFTSSTYVIWRYPYAVEDSTIKGNNKTVYIYNQPFYGDIQVLAAEKILITKEWDIDLDGHFPESLSSHNKQAVFLSKIYRVNDFVGDYNQFYSKR